MNHYDTNMLKEIRRKHHEQARRHFEQREKEIDLGKAAGAIMFLLGLAFLVAAGWATPEEWQVWM